MSFKIVENDSNVEESDDLDHSTMNLETSKKMFSHLKPDDGINIAVKQNGAWMIEVY